MQSSIFTTGEVAQANNYTYPGGLDALCDGLEFRVLGFRHMSKACHPWGNQIDSLYQESKAEYCKQCPRALAVFLLSAEQHVQEFGLHVDSSVP